MKLCSIVTNYRNENNLSQREFARRCNLSNSYISFIEKEINPKTGKPLTPTLEQYRNIANGMNMSVQELFDLLDDDAPVSLARSSVPFISDEEMRLVTAYRNADNRSREDAYNILIQHQVKKDAGKAI